MPTENDPDRALTFFREIVEPTVAEFMADKSDKRWGCLAALAMATMTEHFHAARPDIAAGGTSKRDFSRQMRKPETGGSGVIGLIADVANATKHCHRDGSGMAYEGINAMETDNIDVARIDWPIGGGMEILVGDLQHPEWRLSELLEKAADFWKKKLID